jgi:hypothetical protein
MTLCCCFSPLRPRPTTNANSPLENSNYCRCPWVVDPLPALAYCLLLCCYITITALVWLWLAWLQCASLCVVVLLMIQKMIISQSHFPFSLPVVDKQLPAIFCEWILCVSSTMQIGK